MKIWYRIELIFEEKKCNLRTSGVSGHSEFPCYPWKNGTFEISGVPSSLRKNMILEKKTGHMRNSGVSGHSEFPWYPWRKWHSRISAVNLEGFSPNSMILDWFYIGSCYKAWTSVWHVGVVVYWFQYCWFLQINLQIRGISFHSTRPSKDPYLDSKNCSIP